METSVLTRNPKEGVFLTHLREQVLRCLLRLLLQGNEIEILKRVDPQDRCWFDPQRTRPCPLHITLVHEDVGPTPLFPVEHIFSIWSRKNQFCNTICSFTSRDHSPRVFLGLTFSLLSLDLDDDPHSISNGNRGVCV